MGIRSLDHLYVETSKWEDSVAFWGGLGFEFAGQWGTQGHRAGRLETSGAAIVLAEVAPDAEPAFNAFFDVSDIDEFQPGSGVEVVTPLESTHWGTRWIRVRDPEGRVYAFESPAED